MFRFELERGEMENRNITRNLRRSLNQVIVWHEQVENGVAINMNWSVDKIYQQFITPRKKFQSEYKHPWIEEKHACHRTPHVTPIISYEVQTSEA